MEGRTHLSDSAWVQITCRPNPKPVFSVTQSPTQIDDEDDGEQETDR